MTCFPQSVCFRVTRACNARCGFCLAPWDGEHPDAAVLAYRVDWLLRRGVRAVHFCGGEPTIHPALPELIAQVDAWPAATRLTTNGLVLSAPLLETLRRCDTHVKVSVHGEAGWHDRMVGREGAFERATSTLQRLLAGGVRASVQTTLVARDSTALPAMVEVCLRLGVRRLSLLPFIPRGSGAARETEFALSTEERRSLRDQALALRRKLCGRLDIRWLDFSRDRAAVVEADGRVVLEGPREGSDVLLDRIAGGDRPRAGGFDVTARAR